MTDDTTQNDLLKLQEELAKVQADLNEMTETAKRALADLQNFKRRTEEERSELQVFANARLLEAIFPALDNFARAFELVPEDLEEEEWIKGIQGIESNLMSALASLGLQVIDQAGIPANPQIHEVLMEEEGPTGTVVQIFEKGYSFKGKTIRPAKVSVGRTTESTTNQ
ncbi:MAG: nucleotide exchange factor GrpE [Candidatus Gracilibacteria bacterium]|jgi:molecular chaperone GrpE